jgi:hypothetical protein
MYGKKNNLYIKPIVEKISGAKDGTCDKNSGLKNDT